MAVAAREIEAALVQDAHDLGDGADFRKVWNTSPSRSCTSMLGSLRTIPLGSRTRPIGKHEREVAALGLGKQSGSQPAADRV